MREINQDDPVQQQEFGVLDSIDVLKVKFDAGASTRSKTLYGNGRMQVKVQVIVSGCDKDLNRVLIPAEVLETIQLINYDSGRKLSRGWLASSEQGRFTLEAQASSAAEDDEDNENSDDAIQSQVCTFWVSATTVGTTQIAASIKLSGKVVRSNGTGQSLHDSSIVLEALEPITYSIEHFRWNHFRRGNEQGGNRIYNYYLGLYPQGRQIRLVEWESDSSVDSFIPAYGATFTVGNRVNAPSTNFLKGVLTYPWQSNLRVSLPYDGSNWLYYLTSDAETTKSYSYDVRVNDRDGELTVVQALSEYSILHDSATDGADKKFHFSAIDQYGTAHKLAIRTNFEGREFYLERG